MAHAMQSRGSVGFLGFRFWVLSFKLQVLDFGLDRLDLTDHLTIRSMDGCFSGCFIFLKYFIYTINIL